MIFECPRKTFLGRRHHNDLEDFLFLSTEHIMIELPGGPVRRGGVTGMSDSRILVMLFS